MILSAESNVTEDHHGDTYRIRSSEHNRLDVR